MTRLHTILRLRRIEQSNQHSHIPLMFSNLDQVAWIAFVIKSLPDYYSALVPADRDDPCSSFGGPVDFVRLLPSSFMLNVIGRAQCRRISFPIRRTASLRQGCRC